MTVIKHSQILKSLLDHDYSLSSCFICSEELGDHNRTDEHVVPKWIQRRYDLWDKEISLSNDTRIQYRKLTIPCCIECNGRLANLEQQIQQTIDKGYKAINGLPNFLIWQWLAKIFLGLYYKELFLNIDRSKPSKGKLMNPDLIRDLDLLHFWLQISWRHTESEFIPGSLVIIKTINFDDDEIQFDLMDNFLSKTLAIRVEKVGFIAQFIDFGVHERNVQHILEMYKEHEYNPIQFREFATKFFYKASLLDLKIDVTINEKPNGLSCLITWKAPADGDSIFMDWDQEIYAHLLSRSLGMPLEDLYKPPDQVLSWIPWDRE